MICEKCDFISNSVFITDEGCTARLENNIWSKGCQYHSSDSFMRIFANKYIGTAPKSKEEMIDSLLSFFELGE